MNILFLTLSRTTDINKRGIYTDLMRKFRDKGHAITIVTPTERRFNEKTQLINQENISILKVKTLNIQKTNIIEKGIGTILLEHQFYNAINKYLSGIKFDLILYSTPPITLTSVIKSLKNKTGAKTYLLLKDIFPQNAADLGMLNQKGLIYRLFRIKEKNLYALSDQIGCMSPANVNYLLKHNPEIPKEKLEVNPNTIELTEKYITLQTKCKLRIKYNIPLESTVFVYGGNIGKPQGLAFLLEVIQSNEKNKNVFFLIVGSGIEFNTLNKWINKTKPKNAHLMAYLPKEEYNQLLQACDVGLIFLDKRFTIPNFPSRLLPYLEFKMPIIAATDLNTDIGTIAEKNGFGFSLINGDLVKMDRLINTLSNDKQIINSMGVKGYEFLKDNYLVEYSVNIILKHFE